MLSGSGVIRPLDHHISFGKALLYITLGHLDVLEQVALRVDRACLRLAGLHRAGDHRERVERHLDQVKTIGAKTGKGFLGLEAFRMLVNDPRFAEMPMLLPMLRTRL